MQVPGDIYHERRRRAWENEPTRRDMKQGTIAYPNHFGVAGWNGSCCCVSTCISVLQNHSKLTGYDKLVVSRAV
jgi:hypothetical protein